MAAAGAAPNHVEHGCAWPRAPLSSLGTSPSSATLAMPGGEFSCKLPMLSMMKPPALMVNSMRQLDSSPTVTPSVLWPPTPSPSSAMSRLRMSELAFRPAGPMVAMPEECLEAPSKLNANAGAFVPLAPAPSKLNANAGVFVPLAHALAPALAPAAAPQPQYLQPPLAPPADPAPTLPQLTGHAVQSEEAPASAPQLPVQSPRAVPAAEADVSGGAAAAGANAARGAGGSQRTSTTSAGSSLHGSGDCRPCAWYYKPKGCHMGNACGFCHVCPEGELKNRKKAKVAAMREGLCKPTTR